MGFIASAFYFFTPYTDAQEQAVARFFKGLNERSREARIRSHLDPLLQHNIAVINLWTEYKYKGYKYLRKSERKKLYANLQLIAEDFDRFYTQQRQSAESISLATLGTTGDPEKIALLRALMNYFSPARGTYEYRDSSSFGRLLRDPAHEKLVGDCNQIVTLYMYLYSRYYDVRDLQVRTLPEHVALHYAGIDIEATTGTFTDYGSKKGSALLPAEEVVSINLLDTTDSYLATHEVAPEDFLQASRFAFVLSHDRDIVALNLRAAYGKLVKSLMERDDYAGALKFAQASHDMLLLNVVGHNGAVYEMKRHHYTAARRFAEHAAKKGELIHDSWQAEGAHYYEAHRYHDAIKAFKHISDQASIHKCYEALFFAEQDRLSPNLTTETIKQHTRTIRRMRTYAKKSGNKKLIEHANSLSKLL